MSLFFVFMRLTVSDIMTRIASSVNQEATSPSVGGSEWSLWLSFINSAQDEWASAQDWEVLRKTIYPGVTGASQATLTLPLDYKNLAAPVRLHFGNTPTVYEFPKINDEQEGWYVSTAPYVKTIGDNSTGLSLFFNPGTLASGASLEITYFSMPTALATSTSIPVVPDPNFLIDRTIGFIFQARSDPRFQQIEARAREKLLLMVSQADEDKYANYSTPNNVSNNLRRQSFRVGRD
jgi:hypothetical protein